MVDSVLYDNTNEPVAEPGAFSLANGTTAGFTFKTGTLSGTLSNVLLGIIDATPSDNGDIAIRLLKYDGFASGFGDKVADLGLFSDSTFSYSTTPTNIPVTQNITLDPNTMYIIEATGVGGCKAVLTNEPSDAGTGVPGNVNILLSSGGSGGAAANYEDGAIISKVTENVVCFASGTRIRLVCGDVAVENLAIGDMAIMASGACRPIRWIGSRTLDLSQQPEARPVRISAHAFGTHHPARDLLVSPGHSVCVDVAGEVLIPAIALVNSSTIRQVDVEKITYWHLEFDTHDIVLAENLPSESYLEMGNRGFFLESDIGALIASPDAPVLTHADFCRPYHVNGPIVDAVRSRLTARADAFQDVWIKRAA